MYNAEGSGLRRSVYNAEGSGLRRSVYNAEGSGTIDCRSVNTILSEPSFKMCHSQQYPLNLYMKNAQKGIVSLKT